MGQSPHPSAARIERIGILGAGRAGTALARAAATAGIAVNIASSRPVSQMKYHLAQYAPQAQAVPAQDIGAGVDFVVLMVPQEDLDDVAQASLAGLVLLDATNRWQDEPLPDWLEISLRAGLSSSEAIAAHFPESRVVKALNHISHWDLDSDGSVKAGHRRALGIATDYPEGAALAETLISALGYEPVRLANLAAGHWLEPDGEIFNQVLGAEQLRSIVRA
ncbi:NADPH-dependent F420 reductase [Glutamicibacter arilaitensis]|uniref:NADPH-dependent F420 reductase n=1 Tax=Glutamicibacter arilaitensis TaxID=256701 RepID=UPI003850F96D